ncbi:thiol-activated cytolysin family protein [Arcanobacterium phocae]|nr:thiol-activated cytolysin family protein [Arcanobacterium phocae]
MTRRILATVAGTAILAGTLMPISAFGLENPATPESLKTPVVANLTVDDAKPSSSVNNEKDAPAPVATDATGEKAKQETPLKKSVATQTDGATTQASNTREIDKYVRSLQYDPVGVLAVQGEHVENVPVTSESYKNGTYTVFKHEKKSFNNLRGDLSVIEANNAAIYPGALVKANENLSKGSPTAVGIERAPQVISVDLPGLVDGKNRKTIDQPNKSTVEQGVNELLQGWTNLHATYPNHAAKISYDESMVNSKEQLEAKFGLGFEKVANKLDVNFEAIHKHEHQAAIASFKQIFFTVSTDTPNDPHDLFGKDVTKQDLIDRGIDGKNPLGYVSNVSYGRQIFVKLETDSTDNEVKAAFNAVFKGSFGNGKADAEAKYKKILNQTRATVYILGGSAKSGVEVATGNIDDLKRIIKEESTYSTNVPAVPVSYTVNFLKDNQRAVVQNTGDYIETTATTYNSGFITLRHKGGYVAKVDLTWDEISYDDKGVEHVKPFKWHGTWKARTRGFRERIQIPPNARNVHLIAGEATGLAWDPWWTIIDEKNIPIVKDREIVLRGTTLNPWFKNIVHE